MEICKHNVTAGNFDGDTGNSTKCSSNGQHSARDVFPKGTMLRGTQPRAVTTATAGAKKKGLQASLQRGGDGGRSGDRSHGREQGAGGRGRAATAAAEFFHPCTRLACNHPAGGGGWNKCFEACGQVLL